jgi:hypothetical protein
MSIKLILLQSGEQIVTDAKEIIKDESTIAYLFKNPQKVSINRGVISLEEVGDAEENNDKVQITLGPWILLTSDEEIAVPASFVITVVEPIESLVDLYKEKTEQKEELPVSSDELEQLRGMYSMEQLQKLSEMYSPEELEELKAMYFGNKNGTNDQVSSTEE